MSDEADWVSADDFYDIPWPTTDDETSNGRPDDWLERASDLLLEDDPGPTPFLVEELLVDHAIGAIVGQWKVAKSYALLELAVAIVTGRPAFGKYAIPKPGPVMLVMEESGRAAFHRRIDSLCRGYALEPQTLAGLYFAANRGVSLSDPSWQNNLLDAVEELKPRVVMLDPFVRLKGATIDESSQREIGPVLDFLRVLRDHGPTGVLYAHHTGHQGTHQRGSSDLEGYWESRLAISKDDEGTRTITAEHREAESGHTFQFLLEFDESTRSLRLNVKRRGELWDLVEAYLREHPTASKNEVAQKVDGRRSDLLRIYDEVRATLGDQLDVGQVTISSEER